MSSAFARRTTPARFWGRITFALIIGLWGAYALVRTLTSPRNRAEGAIANLSQYHGRGPFSDFDLQEGEGRSVRVHCDYSGDHLFDGEQVAVETLAFGSTLLHLRVTQGRFAGWERKEDDGRFFEVVRILFAVLILSWARIEPASQPRDDSSQSQARV